MITRIIEINEKNLNNPDIPESEAEKLREAAAIIKNGGLVAFPTETVYGLGANAFDENAVKKIYEAKGRPSDNPLIVHFSDVRGIYEYTEVPDTAADIIKKFLPAPLTLVLKKKDGRLNAACKLDTVAVRVPENNTARKLIALSGVPIAAPSANLSGKPSPTSAEHIINDLSGRADMIICGGNSKTGLESTVISFNPDSSINILRSGYITREDLSAYKIAADVKINPEKPPPSPGMKYTHYSPDAPLYILSGAEENVIRFADDKLRNGKTGFLCFDEVAGYFGENPHIISFGAKNNPKEQAHNLFAALNRFNSFDLDIIYSSEPEKTGVGEAVYNRLIRAAGGKIIKV
jgi:L-threonylcarbamoyladenylate synthase